MSRNEFMRHVQKGLVGAAGPTKVFCPRLLLPGFIADIARKRDDDEHDDMARAKARVAIAVDFADILWKEDNHLSMVSMYVPHRENRSLALALTDTIEHVESICVSCKGRSDTGMVWMLGCRQNLCGGLRLYIIRDCASARPR